MSSAFAEVGPILYLERAEDEQLLRPKGGADVLAELVDALYAKMNEVDSRHTTLMVQALRQCRFIVDPARAGTWVVHDEVEQRWLLSALNALSDALSCCEFPWVYDSAPDPEPWFRYFRRTPSVVVDPSLAGSIDLTEYHEWITGKCRHCGITTYGLEDPDLLTAFDFEYFDELADKGDWVCSECHWHLCVDCGERLAETGDDRCAVCRAECLREEQVETAGGCSGVSG